MIVRSFLSWAQTASAAQRAEGAGALARAYLYSDLDPAARRDAEIALTSLLDDPSPLVRRALRLVLTGPGGGTWVLPLALDADGPAEGDADLTVVEDGARFCRIAGKLLDVDAFGGDVDGDATLLADVLAGARAFAE